MKLKIYTDGSCSGNPGPGGWASVFLMASDLFHISGNELETTNNRMELMSVVKTLQEIVTKVKLNSITDIEIVSDSAYVINAINSNWVLKWIENGWKTTDGKIIKNKDLWEQFTEGMSIIQNESKTVTFRKVKGHAGNSLNEYVDKLARAETEEAKKRKAAK